VRTLVDAYGANAVERSLLPNAIVERLRRNEQFWSNQLTEPSDIPTARERLPEFVAWSRREKQYFEAHRTQLAGALR